MWLSILQSKSVINICDHKKEQESYNEYPGGGKEGRGINFYRLKSAKRHGQARVNDEIKKRVEAAMLNLAYQPNPAARSLRTNRSRIIGLLVSDIQNPFFMQLIQGVEEEALHHEYTLILCNTNENPQREKQYLEVLYSERVAGAIIVPTREWPGEVVLDKFRERQIPIVMVDRRVKDKDVDAVLVDNVRGAKEAVNHLVGNGYRQIGTITGPLNATTGRDRLEGYRQGLGEARIQPDPALERSGDFDATTGRRFTDELLKVEPPMDALFVANNLQVISALNAMHAHNLQVPKDLALVGYDETYWAALGSLSLTTMMQPAYELGSAAVLRLLQRLQNPAMQSRQEVIIVPNINRSRLDPAQRYAAT